MKKLIITLIALCVISSCINCSASAVYSDNFTGTDTTVSYSGMQPGFVLSGSNEICAKSLSSYAFATYKLNDANSVSATFYTPIYPTATQTGDVTVLGSSPHANVFVDGSGNIVTKAGNEWLALAFNENTFAYEFSTPIQTVNEITLTPFLFSIYTSSDGDNYSPISYSISCAGMNIGNQNAVATQIYASLPPNTQYVRIAVSNPPSSLVSGFFCYLASVTIGYIEQTDSGSSLYEDISSSEGVSSSSEISSSSEVSSSSDDNSTTKRNDIDKDISSKTIEEDIDEESSSSKENSSIEDTSSSSKPKDKVENSKPSSSKPNKSSSSKALQTSDENNDAINAEEYSNTETSESSTSSDDNNNNDDVTVVESEHAFPIGAVIYMSALAIAGVVILIIKMKK